MFTDLEESFKSKFFYFIGNDDPANSILRDLVTSVGFAENINMAQDLVY